MNRSLFFAGCVSGALALAGGAGCASAEPTDGDPEVGQARQAQGGGGGMQLGTTGLFMVDAPARGEPAIAGLVTAVLSANRVTPPDTIVTINGIPMVSAAPLNGFRVNPVGTQPALGPDGALHVVASSASAKATRALTLPCPARAAVTSRPAFGASLTGASTLTLSWASLPVNVASVVTFFDANHATLSSYDAATGGVVPSSGTFQLVNQGATSTTLTVPPPMSTAGYQAALRYAGLFVLDGNSGGVCGIEERFRYAR